MSDQQEKDMTLVKKHAADLAEHFDSVQIFANRHESGTLDGTVAVNTGCGNWYARYGQVREWVVISNEITRINERDKDS